LQRVDVDAGIGQVLENRSEVRRGRDLTTGWFAVSPSDTKPDTMRHNGLSSSSNRTAGKGPSLGGAEYHGITDKLGENRRFSC
jgi:hypothetical protein